MRKIILTLIILSAFAGGIIPCEASIISDRTYRREQLKIAKEDVKLIKDLFKSHNEYANSHDLSKLKQLYSPKFYDSDGYDFDTYFKTIDATWKSCEDLTYSFKITDISVNGDFAEVEVDEVANGTVVEEMESLKIPGEIHGISTGIYHLTKINGRWFILGETSIKDESSLLYGDARFMNIELQAPAQVMAGSDYTVSLKVDANSDDLYIMGSIEQDKIIYPSDTPKGELRSMNSSQILERIIKANSDNVNEYAVGSAAISKIQALHGETMRIYLAGLACVMKRVNVIPKNNFIKSED